MIGCVLSCVIFYDSVISSGRRGFLSSISGILESLSSENEAIRPIVSLVVLGSIIGIGILGIVILVTFQGINKLEARRDLSDRWSYEESKIRLFLMNITGVPPVGAELWLESLVEIEKRAKRRHCQITPYPGSIDCSDPILRSRVQETPMEEIASTLLKKIEMPSDLPPVNEPETQQKIRELLNYWLTGEK